MKTVWIVPFALIVDQASKYLVQSTMHRNASIRVLGDFFRLTYIHNSGAAFGLNLGSPLLHTLVSVLALGVLAWLFWSTPRENRLMRVSLALVLGGALGNIVDRIHLREVVDFFDFGIGDVRWPVFNFADTFVTIGILLLALSYSRQKRAEGEERPESGPSGEQAAQG